MESMAGDILSKEGSAGEIHPEAQIHIVADDREAPSGVIPVLEGLPGVSVRVCRLKLGDYEVVERCLFERKTVTDFAVSLVDGRLFSQMYRLRKSSLPGVLVIEGTAADLSKTGVRREALQGALITISLIHGIPVLRSLNPTETARLMVYASSQLLRHERGITGTHKKPRRLRNLRLSLLLSLPGVGSVRARRLLDRFKTVRGFMNASREQIGEVEGFGEKSVERIWKILGDESEPPT